MDEKGRRRVTIAIGLMVLCIAVTYIYSSKPGAEAIHSVPVEKEPVPIKVIADTEEEPDETAVTVEASPSLPVSAEVPDTSRDAARSDSVSTYLMVPDTIVRELELKGRLFRAILTGMEVRIEYPESVSDDEILQFIQREEKKYGLSRAGVTYSIEDGYAIVTFPENFTTRKISQWISIWMDDARVFVRDL